MASVAFDGMMKNYRGHFSFSGCSEIGMAECPCVFGLLTVNLLSTMVPFSALVIAHCVPCERRFCPDF
jgi:hypothetical protein